MKNTISERIFDFLKNYPPFNIVTNATLLEVAQNVEIQYFEKDQVIFSQNDLPHEHFYIINQGSVRLYRFVENEKQMLDICDEGDLFGLRPLIMKENYLMGASANEETILYAIPISLFHDIILNYPKVSQFLIASFATNTREPFSEKHKGKLFANVSAIQKIEHGFSEIQSANYNKNPITCSPDTTVQTACIIMTKNVINSIIVTENEIPIGIITDKDIRTKIGTGLYKITNKVVDIMTKPVVTFPQNISVAEAQIMILKHKVSHLCITKDGTNKSELVGILTQQDLILTQGNSPSLLIKEIKNAKDAETLKHIRTKASDLTKGYLEQEIPIYFVTKVISEINTAITKKAIRMSISEIGKQPPVSFSWLALGSQGRKEQLLMTDQDNALVFENVGPAEYNAVKNYFLELAEKVTEKLNIVGFDYCPANIMASNPKWCITLEEWEQQFEAWITDPIPEKILLSIIFFDFELIYGDETLYTKMAESVFKTIEKNQIFLSFLGKVTLDNPPPLGFFKQFLVEQDGENKDSFDIKSRAIRPLVDAARILSLYHNLRVNNTISRYEKLMEVEPQNRELFESCANAFKILLQFRTSQGLRNNDNGKFVDINNLNKADRLKLKSCFKPIKNVQEAIKMRFKTSQIAQI
ncbi:MAG: nucleotidyltransferase [Bacteroidetes bacterium HGW-Bacteroidetes-3]|jgi:CBS domain-containing protein|nr:MAG: nucleotidyltransferase [Bacteroidetes bacterium HGW-Bacteroidetes-3]